MTSVEQIRKSIKVMRDADKPLGFCDIIRAVTKAHPKAPRKALKEVLVGDLGLNPGTVSRQIQEARKK
jgi:hypothetical protein